MALNFTNKDVKKTYDINSDLDKDFKVHVPKLQWYGMFSEITPAITEQLVKENYNHLTPKANEIPL